MAKLDCQITMHISVFSVNHFLCYSVDDLRILTVSKPFLSAKP